MTLEAGIAGAGLWGPGLEGWAASLPVLRGEAAYVPAPSPPPAPAILPANERRRTGPVIRLALAVAGEAAARAAVAPASLPCVFASSNGDSPVVTGILETLAQADADARMVSPTGFHNSVHNAAAGYWSIATGSRQAVSCLGCHDDSWAAGLLLALSELRRHGGPVLLCAYDHPMPPPLDAKRPTLGSFGAALVLVPPRPGLALLRAEYADGPADAALAAPLGEALRPLAAGNPAGRALRLLEMLARGLSGPCPVGYLDGRLDVVLTA
jgi:hypothetical protein